MPIQKGKRNKKPRRRGLSEVTETASSAVGSSSASPVRRQTAPQGRRRGWQPPLLVNVILGFGMVIFGIVTFVIPQHGAGMTQRLIFLVLYFLIAGLYLGKAFQQYRARQRE